VQTLFYGIFSAWVLWHKRNPNTGEKFRWREAAWELRVPMISVLFDQIATSSNLRQLNLVEVLDWTGNVLNRVAREEFFQKFAEEHAVQYFYEPFLEAFDPNLRKELGVWYTPPEIVKYMVERVDRVLREELGLLDGLADESVYILDPACGTGAYLVEVLRRVNQTLEEKGEDATRGQKLKTAVQSRVFGFEILPAPVVVAHLQIGLLLEEFGVGLQDDRRERAGVYLTNSLTGWDESPKTKLPFPEFEEERSRADRVKKTAKILVVLGNPPYNGLAGVAIGEERELSNAYRTTKRAPAPQGQGLNELYVRFFRMAERRIAEISKQGVVCYISNYSWLEGLSHTGMRERYLEAFDKIWIDNLHGDRIISEVAPDGKSSNTIFAVQGNSAGIKVGTAISLFVKSPAALSEPPASAGGLNLASQNVKANELPTDARPPAHAGGSDIFYRDFDESNSQARREALLASLNENADEYQTLAPNVTLGYPFKPHRVVESYFDWSLLPELFPVSFPGVNTGRDDVLVSIDHERLIKRMENYFDAKISHEEMKRIAPNLMKESNQFEARETREYLIKRGFKPENIVRYVYRPFDTRWLYWEGETKLLDRNRADYFPQIFEGNVWIVAAQQNRREFNSPFAPKKLASMHIIERGTTLFPLYLAKSKETLFDAEKSIVPNLSEAASEYLETVSGEAADLFFHSLAILHSSEYRSEHASALRQNFPRVPLPKKREDLIASSALGKRIAELLDTEKQVAGVTGGKLSETLRTIGVAAHAEGLQFGDDDFRLTARWGHAGKDNVTMPGKGKTVEREFSEKELEAIAATGAQSGLNADEMLKCLGEKTFDVYLNDVAYWRNVPERVWQFYIGGYQVLKKWLSYRQYDLLGRALTLDEITEATNMIRRISAVLLLEPQLNENYRKIKTHFYTKQ
jgi:predicted helicase